jgi:hypothetical protein
MKKFTLGKTTIVIFALTMLFTTCELSTRKSNAQQNLPIKVDRSTDADFDSKDLKINSWGLGETAGEYNKIKVMQFTRDGIEYMIFTTGTSGTGSGGAICIINHTKEKLEVEKLKAVR